MSMFSRTTHGRNAFPRNNALVVILVEDLTSTLNRVVQLVGDTGVHHAALFEMLLQSKSVLWWGRNDSNFTFCLNVDVSVKF